MKKLLIWALVIGIALCSISAGAEYANATVIDKNEDRSSVSIQPAGENETPPGYSPTTGRNLNELSALAEGQDVLGMAVTGTYYPVMVQENGICGATGIGAPWNGKYADVYYELPKSKTGHTRMCMIFNDFHPRYVGATRSTRVGYLWIRQEWNAPYLFAGMQTSIGVKSKYNTNCEVEIKRLNLPSSYNSNIPLYEKVLFNGLDGGGKPWLAGKYRVNGLSTSCNVVWDLIYEVSEVLGKERTFSNHAWKFSDDLPEGDTADTVYVMFKNDKAASGDADDPDAIYYFNSMYEYNAEENVYYRSMIRDLQNPKNDPVPFVEQVASNCKTSRKDGGNLLSCDRTLGDAITFSNVIIQFVEEQWPTGEAPYPIMTGRGSADYFMGGKHIKGVWNRDTYDDRTVFYGENGEEISLQRGRTMIIIMDKDTDVREVRYE